MSYTNAFIDGVLKQFQCKDKNWQPKNQPGWRWVWTTHRMWGSSGSVGCLNIYCHLHKLGNERKHRSTSLQQLLERSLSTFAEFVLCCTLPVIVYPLNMCIVCIKHQGTLLVSEYLSNMHKYIYLNWSLLSASLTERTKGISIMDGGRRWMAGNRFSEEELELWDNGSTNCGYLKIIFHRKEKTGTFFFYTVYFISKMLYK